MSVLARFFGNVAATVKRTFAPTPQVAAQRRASAMAFLKKEHKLPRPLNAAVQALQPKNLLRTAVMTNPQVMGSGVAGRVGGVISRGWSSFKDLTTRATVSPIANMGMKQAGKTLLAGALGTTGLIVGGQALYSAASGEKYNFPSWRTIGLSAVGGAFTPSFLKPFFVGAGFGRRAEKWGVETIKDFLPAPPTTPTPFPIPNYPDFETGSTSVIIEGMSAPPAPNSTFMPSFSFSGGGGGGDISSILLALLGAGAGGYILGKRKKKRRAKKYKRVKL